MRDVVPIAVVVAVVAIGLAACSGGGAASLDGITDTAQPVSAAASDAELPGIPGRTWGDRACALEAEVDTMPTWEGWDTYDDETSGGELRVILLDGDQGTADTIAHEQHLADGLRRIGYPEVPGGREAVEGFITFTEQIVEILVSARQEMQALMAAPDATGADLNQIILKAVPVIVELDEQRRALFHDPMLQELSPCP